ncbi:MAG: outer membrane protein assembly factor BamD [Rubrivivax sp.]
MIVPHLGRALAAGLLALALLVAGCSSTPTKGEAPDATAEKLYREGRDELGSGAYERAIKLFERVEGLAAGTLLAQQAQLDMAYAQWRSNERTAALATIDRFIKLNPSSPALDYAMYLRGTINFNENLGLLGNLTGQRISERDQRASRDAWQAYKQLVDQFPNSRYAPDARLRMDFIANSLAEYELGVARYYFRRGAYLAAVNRAQQTVTEFPRSPSVEEALALMVRGYDKLGLATLRDDAQRVLRRNFPRSAYLADAEGAADKPWWRFW